MTQNKQEAQVVDANDYDVTPNYATQPPRRQPPVVADNGNDITPAYAFINQAADKPKAPNAVSNFFNSDKPEVVAPPEVTNTNGGSFGY